jgi:hypothetical protein
MAPEHREADDEPNGAGDRERPDGKEVQRQHRLGRAPLHEDEDRD